ncbi:MAG: endopeptidase La [Acidobacteria bacterium]|nr:endopeptidase La [Acidobacteriota bacterium]
MPESKIVTLPLIPIRDVVVFPQTMFPFIIGRQSSIRALEYATQNDRRLFLATQKDPSVDDPSPEDIYHQGTLAVVIQNLRIPEGNIKVLVEGVNRAKVLEINKDKGFFLATVQVVAEKTVPPLREEEDRQRLTETFEEYIKYNPAFNLETAQRLIRSANLGKITDNLCHSLPLDVTQKQKFLETPDPEKRLEMLIAQIGIEIEKIKMDKDVQTRVREQMDKAQKEYYLHEKIKAIQKELGEDEHTDELEELKKKVGDSGMHTEAAEKVMKEIRRMEQMPPMSAETTVSRNYVDWLISLPWKRRTKENRDILKAQKVLDEDHYGLEKIKERILEFLAVRLMTQKSQGTILCFVGPPGVGKTSLGKSIARATGRKFIRISLGGVRDEAEIRGHRRTYIGAFPGQIIQMMKKAGSVNPVFLLDEVDKMSTDFRGDPSAALLEVLDPEQNRHFVDHYVDTEYNLSQVMFITTANTLHAIPRPLQDRMEILELSGYTEKEKLEIARQYLLPKQRKACGLEESKFVMDEGAILCLIRHYTRESGVRNLEREIGRIGRKIVRRILTSEPQEGPVRAEDIPKFLGAYKYRVQMKEKKNECGMAVGMAWTETGGEILFTETGKMPGTGKIILTGQLGEVMQESAQAALSYVRSRLDRFYIDPKVLLSTDVHVHVPEGAIPKDGPSAGITMGVSILSALTGIPVRGDVAMTGEITLRGKVLPIGGVKEKVLAAHRSGIFEIILPDENRKDVEDIPAEVLEQLKINFVETMDDVLAIALERLPAAPVEPLALPIPTETGKEGVAN